MQSIISLLAAGRLLGQPSTPLGPTLTPAFPQYQPARAQVDSGPRRPAAIEYSDLYGIRLTVHRYASYATLPLFAAEYAIGRSLYNRPGSSESLRSAHGAVAGAIAGLFAVNTVTGVWNLWEGRKDPAGRARRYVHSALMLAADAGFVWTSALAPDDDAVNTRGRSMHRTVAISSMGVALAGYALMLIWKD